MLAIGIVVDDAIVVVEGVEHHIEAGMEPLAACERAMKELTAPILGISLVLTSVFLPSAFISGITGQLFKQFALTITISVNLSALVALTLTPALCALIIRKRQRLPGPLGWFIDKFNAIFATVTSAYMNLLQTLMRRVVLVIGLLAGCYVIVALLGMKLPAGFVPDEDQGVVYAVVQLPFSSSLDRNSALIQKMEADLAKVHGVADVIACTGYNLLTSIQTPDTSSFIIVLQPWEERGAEHLTLHGIISDINDKMNAYPEAASFPFVPPTIPGLGNASGFAFELQDTGGHTVNELATVADKVVAEARKRPEVTAMNNTMRTTIPQLDLDVDRDRAALRGVAVSDVYKQLQANLGGLVVDEFTYFNRTWDVMIQAEPDSRANANSINQISVRNSTGDMVPLRALTTVRPGLGTDFVQRFNTNREVEIFGSNAPGYSTGQAIAAMVDVAKTAVPAGYTYGWSGTSYQEVSVGNTQSIIFIFSVLLVFLALAAQYESWTMPLSVLLAVPTGILGAFLSVLFWRLDNNAYVQIGIIMLIGLAAKNAILIVEFARERRAHGASIAEAAVDAARLRFRPILMTSFAFIIGVIPLMFAHGAGAASRQSLGSTVFAGMLAATCLGIFFTPTLYELAQKFAERGKKGQAAAAWCRSNPPPSTWGIHEVRDSLDGDGAADRVVHSADVAHTARRANAVDVSRADADDGVTGGMFRRHQDDDLGSRLSIDRALQKNFDVELAYANILEAEASLGITAADQSVFVNGILQAPYDATTGAKPPGTPSSQFSPQAGIAVSYQVDLFGKLASATGAARDQLLSTEAAKDTVLETVVAQVATAYQLRSLDASSSSTEKAVTDREEGVRLMVNCGRGRMSPRCRISGRPSSRCTKYRKRPASHRAS